MKTAFQIFRRDVPRLLKNLSCEMVLPHRRMSPAALYAWFNRIAANMFVSQKLFG